MKKSLKIFLIALLIFAIIFAAYSYFYQALPLTEYLLKDETRVNPEADRIERIEKVSLAHIQLFSGPYDIQRNDITDEDFLDELLLILNQIIIRPQVFATQVFYPTYGNSYMINIRTGNLWYNIRIMDSKHLDIMDSKIMSYKITGGSSVTEIYDLLVRYELLESL
jgi:hypothetical protein